MGEICNRKPKNYDTQMNTLRHILCLLLLALLGANAAAQVETYPVADANLLNPNFRVTVNQGGKSLDSPVYCARVLNRRGGNAVETCGTTQFSFGGAVEVCVEFLGGSIDSARIRPLSLGLKPAVEGNRLRFRLNQPENLSVEVNGDIYHNLLLFANPMPQAPRKADIVFRPGVHQLPGDSLVIGSNTSVWIDGGAIVKGQIVVKDAENVRISGRGYVDCPSREGIYLERSRNVMVEGVATSQVPCGNCDDVTIDNVKVVSFRSWGDGFNTFASSNITYRHCFARTSDDCTTVYATRKGFVGSSRNISMTDCVLWADIAHPIFIGLHGNVERPDTVENLTYRDIDILGQCEQQVDYQGCLAIGAGDLNLVRDVLFEDIRIESIACGQILNLRTTHNQKYCLAPGRAIENITFRRVTYTGPLPNLSIVAAHSPENPIRGLHFQDFTLNGRHIYDAMPERPKWYKTSDFAHAYIGENVQAVTFE